MKLNRRRLRRLIKEEYRRILLEADYGSGIAQTLGQHRLQKKELELSDAEYDYDELKDEADREAFGGEFGGYGGSDLMDSDYAYELEARIEELQDEIDRIRNMLAQKGV